MISEFNPSEFKLYRGKGSYGTIFKSNNFPDVICKKIGFYDHGKFKVSFETEVESHKSLKKHTNINHLLQSFVDEKSDIGYLFLEENGCDLYEYYGFSTDHFENSPKRKITTISVMEQIFTGLSYIHSLKIIHCDVKLENVLIKELSNGDVRVQICDFGCSQFLEKTKTLQTIGTPEYRPPEVILSDGKVFDYAVDIWATGIVFYELSTGYTLFGAQSGKHLYDASNIFSKLGNPDKDSSLRKLESFYPNLLSSAYSDEKKQSIC